MDLQQFGIKVELTLEEVERNFPSSGARKYENREPDLGFCLGTNKYDPGLPVENRFLDMLYKAE